MENMDTIREEILGHLREVKNSTELLLDRLRTDLMYYESTYKKEVDFRLKIESMWIDKYKELENKAMLSACEVEQALGIALHYPFYCDDQKNFPGTTLVDGVCTGEHVVETIAAEAANRIKKLEEENIALKEKIKRSDNVLLYGGFGLEI